MTDRPSRPDPRVRRRSLWLCLAALAFGMLLGVLRIDETPFRALRLSLNPHPASGRIALVDIDDTSLAMIGKWPIPRSYYASAVDRLFALGARRVFFNMDFSSVQDAQEDARLAVALRAHPGRVFLAARISGVRDRIELLEPAASVRGGAPLTLISFIIDSSGKVWKLPYGLRTGGKVTPSLATAAAGRGTPGDGQFNLDPTIDLQSFPHVSLIGLLQRRADRAQVAGKDVVISSTSEQVQDFFIVPPYGRVPSIYVQAIGIETLREGVPVDLGWLPLVALLALFVLATARRAPRWLLPIVIAVAVILPPAAALLPGQVVIALAPAIGMLALVAVIELVRLAQETLRKREQINRLSGLLNLTALRQLPDHPDSRLVVAHFHNFAEAVAALPPEGEALLVEQIAARLKLGMDGTVLYHGDNGVFAWLAREEADVLGERLDALHALFRSAVAIPGGAVDLAVTFGIDDDGTRSVANRLGSALVAAAEAAAEGTRWRAFDKARLADAAWKLSLLSQLDAAIDDGHLWVAYQPKLDLTTGRLTGAEALVRWTHPEKGPISPLEFIPAAEQNNRIERLTRHVLDRAVLAAATINAHDIPFGIAVNLSARLLESQAIVDAVVETLSTNRLDPSLLTLEITETAAIANGHSLGVLRQLRDLGVRISIDDYGTGLSTLEYLKKVPASEIKIDRVFVQSMLSSTSDLLMVNSTIQLAHSLGHVVVAEGVETDEVLSRLREMACDIAQGYRIGRPMTFQELARRLLADRRRAA